MTIRNIPAFAHVFDVIIAFGFVSLSLALAGGADLVVRSGQR